MAEKKPQTFENHAKIVPAYHVVLAILLLIQLGWSLWRLIQAPGLDAAVGLLLAVALAVIVAFLRLWPLTVQDRLIRLEETLRLQRLLAPELQDRIGELRRSQFVALRFASDDELPGLVQRIVDGELRDAKEIKRAIQTWRPDYLRV